MLRPCGPRRLRVCRGAPRASVVPGRPLAGSGRESYRHHAAALSSNVKTVRLWKSALSVDIGPAQGGPHRLLASLQGG